MTTHPSEFTQISILRSLMIAGLLLGVSAALAFLSPEFISPGLAQRLLGALMGAVVVVYANAAPKALLPLDQLRCAPAAEQAKRRFTGWTLTLGGAAYALAWMIAPLEHANLISASLLGAALLLVVARLVWGVPSGSRA